MICDPFDVVQVPFPFSDLPNAKKRKALVLSKKPFNRANGSSVLLMITSATSSKWALDVQIRDLAGAGLTKPCVARMKLFTLDNELIIGKAGKLGTEDRKRVLKALKRTFPV